MSLLRSIFRRIPRLHLLTWLVALTTAAALVLIIVPGERMYKSEQMDDQWWGDAKAVHDAATTNVRASLPPDAASYLNLTLYQHGWPCVYLVRCTCTKVGSNPGKSPQVVSFQREASKPMLSLRVTMSRFHGNDSSVSTPIAWTDYDHWPVSSYESRLDVPALAVNLLVASAILALVVTATEFWIRRRGGLFRFRIVDLLVAFTVVAVVMAWLERQKQINHVEQQVASYFYGSTTRGWNERCDLDIPRYYGPLWLKRLSGSEVILTRFHHVQVAELKSSVHWREDLRQLQRLPCLTSLHFQQGLPRDAIPLIAQFDNLEHLQIRAVDTAGRIGHDELQELGKLKVRDLSLEAPCILADDIEQLLQSSPQLKRLRLMDPSITLQEVASLRDRHPRIALKMDWRQGIRWPGYVDQPPKKLEEKIEHARKQRSITLPIAE